MRRSRRSHSDTDDVLGTSQNLPPRSSRIPAPVRTSGQYSSRTSTPNRSRSTSQSPTRRGAISPSNSTRSVENLSPIRSNYSKKLPSNYESSGRNLVRYITKDMIQRLAKEEQFEHIRKLSFNLSGDKKIRYIENLEGLKNLTVLNLSNNAIEKIEKLDHLTRLQNLNLSNNRISKIEGIETLSNLQILNFEGNRIERIPIWIGKKLRAIRTIKLANNSISSLSDVIRLSGLHDLHTFSIQGNPLCEIPHHRLYIVFHLRVLNELDDQVVTSTERSDAVIRFSKEELEKLTKELHSTNSKLQQSQELRNQSLEEVEILAAREREMEERDVRGRESREEMERELDAKDELLKKKSKELQRAQAKQVHLEQELAFIKLDVKFDPLNVPHGSDEEGDMPYLGKSRYKRNEMAVESNLGRGDADRRQLDSELSDKQRQLNEAAERLASLQRELHQTQSQVLNATQELQDLERATQDRRLTEEEKEKLRQKLAAKIHKINQIREEAMRIEDELAEDRAKVQNLKLEYDKLRSRIKNLDPNSPEYAQSKSEMHSKEQQCKDLTQQIKDNENMLKRLLKNIAVDTEAIKELEEQLESGTTSSDPTLRHELEEIVEGLQDYLLNVRQKADAQREDFDNLLRDKERLVRRLASLEREKMILTSDADDYSQLQQQVSVLGELNELLQATQDLNEQILGERRGKKNSPEQPKKVLSASLEQAIKEGTASTQQIEEATKLTLDALNKSMSEMQQLNSDLQMEAGQLTKHDADLQTQLGAAERRIEDLNKSMQETNVKNNEDKATLSEQMEEIAKLQNKVGDREAEAAALNKELDRLKGFNRDLSGELESRNARFTDALGSMLNPEEVAERIRQLNHSLRKGDPKKLRVRDEGDVVGKALEGLQKQLFEVVGKENRDKADAEKRLKALENHMKNLKKKLLEAQKEYRDTMEAATEAKLEAEKSSHRRALQKLEDDMNNMRDRLREAEEDAAIMRNFAENQRKKGEEEGKLREERARLHNTQSQAALRELERELGNTKRGMKDKEAATTKQLEANQAQIEGLHRKLQRLEEEREADLADTADSAAVAEKALRDLARAEDEIEALQDLLKAHEREGHGRGRGTMRQLRDNLSNRKNEVDRLRRAIRNLKSGSMNEVEDLQDRINALRDALSSNNDHIRTLWPGYYCYVPGGSKPAGQYVYSPQKGGMYPPQPPPMQTSVIQTGYPMDPSSCGLEPGTPGMIAVREDGTLILVPFEGLFCNVPEHHDLEDQVAELTDTLEKCQQSCAQQKAELDEAISLLGPIQEQEAKLHHLEELVSSHEEEVEKMKKEEERMAREKAETANELANLKDTLNNKLKRKHQLEGRVEDLLGELRTEQALLQHDEMRDELHLLESTLNKRKGELRDSERLMREAKDEAGDAEGKASVMMKRFENARKQLSEVEQDAEEIEKQMTDTGAKLIRARNDLHQIQGQTKECEGHKIKLEDQCRQLARVVTSKESEFVALEQKIEHMTGDLESLQNELIITEEKETERLSALRDSEKILCDRREEVGRLKDQVSAQREELEGLNRMLGKKNTEIQLLQDNIEQHQQELSAVLKEGKSDVQEKQKQIKQLKHEVDELISTRNDLETQITRRKGDITGLREKSNQTEEELQNYVSEVAKQKSELKHILEMLGLEQQELESLRRQHDVKSSELADTQRRLLEERTELDRMNSDAQRRETELVRIKQNVEKFRGDVDQLTIERSTLEDTVNGLIKEKDMLASSTGSLTEKINDGKRSLSEIRNNIDKSGSTLDQLEEELTYVRKEVYQFTQQKNEFSKEASSLKNLSKELKADIDVYKTELHDTQNQLQTTEKDLRAVTKHRDDITLESTSIKEEIRMLSQQLDSLNHQVRRSKEEADVAEDQKRESQEELEKKEKEMMRIGKEADREEERLSRVVSSINNDIQALQRELCEQKDNLEAVIIKRDATKRDMERLGRVECKFEESEFRIGALESRVNEREQEILKLEKEKSELKTKLSSWSNEARANKVETDHEVERLRQKIKDLKGELESLRSKDASEISSLERAAEDHCERATRLSNDLNKLRIDFIQAKNEIRFLEEQKATQHLEIQKMTRRLRTEVDNKVSEGVKLLDSSHTEAVEDLKDLYHENENNQRKLMALREIQHRSPSKPALPSSAMSRRAPPPSDPSIQVLQEELQAKQEEITSQIRRQMSRHREQWQNRKLQSEGKLRSLKKKVDNLDELVSNTSMDSLSHSRGRDHINLNVDFRLSPRLEERENVIPERDYSNL